MAEPVVLLTLALALIDAALSAGLLAVYAQSFRKVRAPFTIGLMIFAACFVAQNLLIVYGYFSMMEFILAASWYVPYILGIMAIQAVGLGVMLYSSAK
jgi:hypothetical protein